MYSIYVYMYVCMNSYQRARIREACACVHTYIHAYYIHVCMYVCMYTYIHTFMHACIHTLGLEKHVHACICWHACIYWHA